MKRNKLKTGHFSKWLGYYVSYLCMTLLVCASHGLSSKIRFHIQSKQKCFTKFSDYATVLTNSQLPLLFHLQYTCIHCNTLETTQLQFLPSVQSLCSPNALFNGNLKKILSALLIQQVSFSSNSTSFIYLNQISRTYSSLHNTAPVF